MNKQRKTSHILNVFQYDADGHVVLPASLTLSIAPGAGDNNSKVPTTSWVRTYVTGLTYATQSYVSTQITNLIDAAPGALDTLNELAAALGDDPNFATTITNSLATKLALTGGTLTGDLTLSGTNPRLYFTDTDNNPDYFISNTDGTFTVYDVTNSVGRFKIYTTGHAEFTNNITAASFIKSGGTSAQFLMADGSVSTNLGWLTGITSGQVTTALGFTPYNSSNPAGYITGVTNITGTAGSISGFNNPTTAATANTIVYRDSAGDIYGRYLFGSYQNSSDDVSAGTITYIMAKFGDNYHRSATAAKVQSFLGLGSAAYQNTGAFLSSSGSVTVGGYLTVNGAGSSSSIYMSDSDEGNREIHCNSNRIGFLTQAGAWGAWCDDSGNWNAANLSGTNTGDQTNISGNSATTSQREFNYLRVNSSDNLYLDWNYGCSIVGVYSSTRYQGIFAMGNSYKLAIDGSTTGSLYGLAWSHPNAGGVAGNLNTHGLLVMENGTFLAAVSGSIRARDDMRAPIFYDQNDTGYYLDMNSTSDSAGRIRGGILFGPNPTWGAYLRVGANGNPDTSVCNVAATNGNLHIDSKAGYAMYLNNYANGNIYFNGGTYYISSNGSYYNGTASYANTAGSAPANGGTSSNTNSISNATGGGYTWTGQNYFQTNNGGSAVNNSNSASLQAYSTGNNTAFMSFHRGGYYAVNFGLDNDNWMRIGGWSAAANRWQLNTVSGDMVVNGDVTAFSDARVKENIVTVDSALDKVLALRGVYYNRNDSEDKKRKMGVIAQETLVVVPEVVNTDAFGTYNVSYGNFAGLFIEAFKEQQKQIEELKSIINGLTK